MAYFVEITETAIDFLDNFSDIDEFATIASSVSGWCVVFENENCAFTFEILPKIEGNYESIVAGYELCKEKYEDYDRYKEHEVLPLSKTFKPLVKYEKNGKILEFNSLDEIKIYKKSLKTNFKLSL